MSCSTDGFTHAGEVLELPQLLIAIAGYAASDAGSSRLRARQPTADFGSIQARQDVLRDVFHLRERGCSLVHPAFQEITALLARARPEGAILAGDELSQIRSFLAATAAVAEFAATEVPAGGALGRVLHRLDPRTVLRQALADSLDDHGELLDGASPLLSQLRRQIRTLAARVQRQLEQLLRDVAPEKIVQEEFVTSRNGRYVIPIKREGRTRIRGVIHDHSDSGRTVFLEPELTLPLGNELADLRLQERDECRRILAELTAGVRASADALTQDQEVLTEIDVLAAIDAWAADFDAVLPRFGERLLLRSCRHPLLERQLRAAGRVAELAPLDLLLPPDARVLLITGPNSGGKTAALKTVGLLALMAQAGLPVPVDPLSEFVCFEQVFADIGDEQSLTRNLSTFTGHLSRIRDVLAGVTHGHSLVLLDELGTGTDPLEGGALACAILNVLAGSGAVTLATSHLSVLKTYVHEQNGMLNAAVRFNVETLTPEYVLDVGRPGASQALTIAAKLGLPEQLLACARELLSSDYLRLENMLAHIEETQRRVSQREREIQEAGQGLAGEREAVRTQLQQLKRERKQLLHDAYQQAAGIVENARQEMDRLLAIARNSAPAAPRVEVCRQAKADLRRRQESLTAGASATAPKPDQPLPIGKLCPGQRVWVEKLRANATIVGIDAGAKRVTVELGALRFTVAAREIGQATGGASGEEAPLRESRPAVGDVQTELKLIGKLVADALPALDQFLNRAAMAALPEVRVIHGFGTGRLRLAVHEFLKQHPLVAGFRLGSGRDPGRGGATLVALKQR